MSFRYEALDRNISQLRLIHLHPSETNSGSSDGSDEISDHSSSIEIVLEASDLPEISTILKCTIYHASLNEISRLKFNALSYTWAPETPTHEIILNGDPFATRRNLWQFLSLATRNGEMTSTYLNRTALQPGPLGL